MGKITERVNVGVGVVVANDEGEYLLGKRIGDRHGAGEYSFPGGKPDPGESPEAAAARELEEETGLVAKAIIPLGFWTYDRFEDHGMHYVTLYFMAVCDGVPVNTEPDKCESWEWYSTDEFPAPLFSGISQMRLGL